MTAVSDTELLMIFFAATALMMGSVLAMVATVAIWFEFPDRWRSMSFCLMTCLIAMALSTGILNMIFNLGY